MGLLFEHEKLTLLASSAPRSDAPLMLAVFAARKSHTANKDAKTANLPRTQTYRPDDLKVLAEGSHSKINDPFVAVVRDTDTYAALSRLDENLPRLDADFFTEHVVIAAFLGQRNTGGYGVEITPSPVRYTFLRRNLAKE